jgi:hypothetical protein
MRDRDYLSDYSLAGICGIACVAVGALCACAVGASLTSWLVISIWRSILCP